MWRDRQYLRGGQVYKEEQEYSFYACSVAYQELSAAELSAVIRNHWAASENGSHYRRDVTLGEDASQVSDRGRAQAMSTLRNLIVGLFELAKEKGEVPDNQYLPGWRRTMTGRKALAVVRSAS